MRSDLKQDIANVRTEIAEARHEARQDNERTNGRINTLTWMVGTNVILTIGVLGRLLFIH